MHIASKVYLGMVLIIAFAGVWLTSKLFQARGAWLQQVAQKQEQVDTIEEDLRKKRLVVAGARNEVNRLMNLWGNSWEVQQGNQVNTPQTGTVSIGAGGNAGIGRREETAGQQKPNVYLFAQTPQGAATKFLGEFRLMNLNAGGAEAQLTRPPYAGEPQQWPAGPWRVRESIPINWRGLFAELRAETVEALQNVQDQNARLAKTDDLNSKSQEQLQRRLAQLDGNPDAIQGSSEEVIDGLVMSLRQEETTRNEDLGRLDQLRHEYDRKYRHLMELIDQNRRLEEQLPGSGSDATPTGAEQQAAEPTLPETR